MEQLVLKTEEGPNGEILMFHFYVDESRNGEGNEGNKTGNEQSAQYLHNELIDLHQNKNIIQVLNGTNDINKINWDAAEEDTIKWLDDDINRLLIFYTDNKEAFLSGTSNRKYLWEVACKTMLHGKNHAACELKLKSMMKKYVEVFLEKRKGSHIMWPYFSACHEAFHDNSEAKVLIEQSMNETPVEIKVLPFTHNNVDNILIIQKPQTPPNSDVKVELMLNLYLKHKRKFDKNESQRGLWELIVLEMGEQDVDYWHRRFLNYKQHYIRMLHKQTESGVDSVTWPYMKIFDQIFKNDEEFHEKWTSKETKNHQSNEQTVNVEYVEEVGWTVMEKTFLVKYYFDCFSEFQDVSIPNMFLWTEVGRFLAKKADECKEKFTIIKNNHICTLMKGGYDLATRTPMEIVLDNIISKETEIGLQKSANNMEQYTDWKTEQVDQLVQFFYDNTEMLKDPVCYYLCWFILGNKINICPLACKVQWEGLIKLYKALLNEKKENPDISINWRYMDLFDRIFDYGMATDLMEYSEKLVTRIEEQRSKIGVKKITIRDLYENCQENAVEVYEDRESMKQSKKAGEGKAFRILEFYLKHKHKFSSSQCKRVALWDTLSQEIGISASDCAHRFRNFKQVYKAYVKRELCKPEKPILWPYYTLCKKVFGYRTIRNKIKNELQAKTINDDWSAKDIKTLINFFGDNFYELEDNIADISMWTPVANNIDRSAAECSNKFFELRKSYRKLRTMKSRNPDVKVSWKYFDLMHEIYRNERPQVREEINETIEIVDEKSDPCDDSTALKQDSQDDDYTIIVVPEAEDFSTTQYVLPSGEDIIQDYTQVKSFTEELLNVLDESGIKLGPKWNKRTKRRLLILYLNYLRAHKGKEINRTDMWTEIASKFGDRKPITCKKMFIKLKTRHKQAVNEDTAKPKTPYFALFEKILSLKPKFARNKNLIGDNRTYKDYPMDVSKVDLALKYYLENIDEFISPKFEKKYLWTELANYIMEPVSKVFNKVNYLIQFYKSNTLEAENTIFGEVLKEIFIKENLLNDGPHSENKMVEEEVECSWTDDEIETLLTWYLAHLEKFKNPKFVRSYLWMEASDILRKSPWACSNKMSEIRTQYRTMVKESPEGLIEWRFATLCQRIYGMGKKNNPINASI